MLAIDRKRVLFAAAAIALVAAAATFALTKGPFAPLEVGVVAAKRATLRQSAFGIGTLEARLAYAVGPTQAARVLKVHVDHGDVVKAGAVLAELDPVDLADRLAGGESALARSRESVRAADAQAREVASRHQVALANARRYGELAQKGFVSRELADNRQNEAQVTRAASDAAQASLAAARHDVERLARERDALAKQLGNLKLLAPVAGVVITRLAEPGTTMVAGQAVIRMIDSASIWVRTRMDQARAGEIRVGDTAQVALRSRPGTPLPGRVARIDIQSDAVTEERVVNIDFVAPPPQLSLGELAEVTVAQQPLVDALVIPSAAVKSVNREKGVWRIDGGRARFHAVRIGAQTLSGESQVLEGLAPGDEVIVHSSGQLKQDARVQASRPE
ncbi:MAG: hypothetical protein A3I63_10395 [Betaproteobacteria bacterium RIFCSPLOWO2_02_FULL_66_14]|nr:MAG: hypothetical protein A3I63_10395 [Betaproteobacteria bacterium RIFCSPLOWO2_02_FULL_66_14]